MVCRDICLGEKYLIGDNVVVGDTGSLRTCARGRESERARVREREGEEGRLFFYL